MFLASFLFFILFILSLRWRRWRIGKKRRWYTCFFMDIFVLKYVKFNFSLIVWHLWVWWWDWWPWKLKIIFLVILKEYVYRNWLITTKHIFIKVPWQIQSFFWPTFPATRYQNIFNSFKEIDLKGSSNHLLEADF